MSVQENWQTKRPTIRERTKFMLNNHLFSDVKFGVRKSDGESESKQVISAHKFVLSVGSPVFEAMFYGELPDTRDSIKLPDCEYESLLELFRYMYSDEVNLSGGNVMEVLYLAKKYIVPSLADKCTEYLQNNLGPSNVFNILPTAEKFEEKELVDRCWKVIDRKTEAAVKSDGFATIERSLLETVVSRETLTIEEIDLFKAVDQWATKECEKQGLATDGEQKRRILGEKIIKAIRFPVMKEKEFSAAVLDAKILSPEEVIIFSKSFNSTLATPVRFSEIRRSRVPHRCGRFEFLAGNAWNYSRRKDFLNFSVDKDIMLHGLCLFGSENNDYEVMLEIKNSNNNLTVVSKAGTFSSKLMRYKGSSYYGFEILFDFAVDLKKATEYRIEAKISGPPSWVGSVGLCVVEMSSVTFTFSTSTVKEHNGTNCSGGQFPEFLFSV